MTKLRHNRPEGVAQRRAQALANAEFKRSDDGFCDSGIVSFGAINYALTMAKMRIAADASLPIPARVTGWDESGVVLSLVCPYCQKEHQHVVVPDEWAPGELLMASCSRGNY